MTQRIPEKFSRAPFPAACAPRCRWGRLHVVLWVVPPVGRGLASVWLQKRTPSVCLSRPTSRLGTRGLQDGLLQDVGLFQAGVVDHTVMHFNPQVREQLSAPLITNVG